MLRQMALSADKGSRGPRDRRIGRMGDSLGGFGIRLCGGEQV